MRILVLNGPNLNLLSKRSKTIYGKQSLKEINKQIQKEFPAHKFTFYQSNSEGELIDQIQSASRANDAIIINPGGYAHTSVSIMDALELCPLLKIEVHLSHLGKRDDYRQFLLTASACDGIVSGFKVNGYLAAVYILEKLLKSN